MGGASGCWPGPTMRRARPAGYRRGRSRPSVPMRQQAANRSREATAAVTAPSRPHRQPVGVHHRQVGEVLVTALNDGMLDGQLRLADPYRSRRAAGAARASFRAVPPRITINAFLLHLGERLVLVDSGCGGAMGPALGRLAENLAAMGVAPEAIDTVLLTHLHPDHVGGLVDAAGHGPAAQRRAGRARGRAAVLARRRRAGAGRGAGTAASSSSRARVLDAYRGRVRQVAAGEVLPGVTAVPEPGHTPGHTGWLIASGGDCC